MDIRKALERLPETQVVSLESQPAHRTDSLSREPDWEATLRLRGRRIQLWLEEKTHLDPRAIESQIKRWKLDAPSDVGIVVVSPHLPPSIKTRIESHGAGWLDDQGNAHIEAGDLFIHVDRGGKPPVGARRQPRRLFAPASARVLRALLQDPHRDYRLADLVAIAGVHVSSASRAVGAFVGAGYMERVSEGWRLSSPDQLLDAWIDDRRLRPEPTRRHFYLRGSPSAITEQLAEADDRFRLALTGLSAAERLMPLIPATAVEAYIEPFAKASQFGTTVGLETDAAPEANLILRSSPDGGAFVGATNIHGNWVVGRAQLVADLYLEEGRAIQAASALREQWQI